MDPYQILNLDPNTSLEEVNRAYFYIAKMYHPNKGGNEAEFLKFQRAYKQIVQQHRAASANELVAPKDFMQLRDQQPVDVQHLYNPNDFNVQDRFNQEMFNRKFQEREQREHDSYTYNIDQLNDTCSRIERKADDYKREYAQVTAEVESMVPFANGKFNNATFNQAFMHLKERSKREDVVDTPNPTASREIMACVNLEKPGTIGTGDEVIGNYTGVEQAYGNSHNNPNKYDRKFLAQFQGRPDITKISALSASELHKRVSDRNNMKLEYNREKLVTDLNVPLQDVQGIDSKKATMQLQQQRELLNAHREQARAHAEAQARAQVAGSSRNDHSADMFQRMVAPVTNNFMNPLGLDRPIATTEPGRNRETSGYIAQPAAILLQGTPPPIQRKRRSKPAMPSDEQSRKRHEDELKQMRRDLRHQQRIIKQLSKRLGDT